MTKRIVLATTLVILTATIASAQGWTGGPGTMGRQQTQGRAATPGAGMYGPRYDADDMMGWGPGWIDQDAEETELTGRLQLAEDQAPVLTSGGTDYVLHIHPALAQEVSVRNGQTITVTGYVANVASPDLLGEDHFVRVTAIEVDGTRVVLPSGTGFGGPMGGFGGHHGGMMGRW
tara:strand:+ start:523 stop:1047 length:525 start_codon:yes stop_codon:yes gene_type:complete